MIGSGTAGKLCALDLASEGHRVTLLARPNSIYNYPVVIPEPALRAMNQRLPNLVKALQVAGARHFLDEDILAKKFDKGSASSPPNVGMLCVSARTLDIALDELVLHNSLVSVVCEAVIGLKKQGQRVVGAFTKSSEHSANWVIDASGAGSDRRKWLEDLELPSDNSENKGPIYNCYTRNFRSPKPMSFRLYSKPNWRGGIYPTSECEFAVSIFTIATPIAKMTPDAFFNGALKTIASEIEVGTWEATTALTLITGIQRRQSDFFSRNARTNGVEGFFPLGDSLFTSNPVYGRSLSSILLQTAALKKAIQTDNVWSQMMRFMPAIHKVSSMGLFRDLADDCDWGIKTFLPKLLMRYYQLMLAPLEDHDPEYYKTLLDVYQMRKNPSALAHPKFQWRSIKYFFSKAG